MADTTPTPAYPRPTGASRYLTIALGAVAALVILATAWHLTAAAAYDRSFDKAHTLQERSAAATRAHQLEPWDKRYETRAVVMQKWLEGSEFLSQGADLPAMLRLQEAYRLDVGDQELLALFKKSQAQLNLNSNYKAHLQHAHEGPGGTLRPQDLVP